MRHLKSQSIYTTMHDGMTYNNETVYTMSNVKLVTFNHYVFIQMYPEQVQVDEEASQAKKCTEGYNTPVTEPNFHYSKEVL